MGPIALPLSLTCSCPMPKSTLHGIEKFTYLPEENAHLCPEGKPLKFVGINKLNRTHLYHSTPKRCRGCGMHLLCEPPS
jgi:hypothetical protein